MNSESYSQTTDYVFMARTQEPCVPLSPDDLRCPDLCERMALQLRHRLTVNLHYHHIHQRRFQLYTAVEPIAVEKSHNFVVISVVNSPSSPADDPFIWHYLVRSKILISLFSLFK